VATGVVVGPNVGVAVGARPGVGVGKTSAAVGTAIVGSPPPEELQATITETTTKNTDADNTRTTGVLKNTTDEDGCINEM
jgi:hypothetical protein